MFLGRYDGSQQSRVHGISLPTSFLKVCNSFPANNLSTKSVMEGNHDPSSNVPHASSQVNDGTSNASHAVERSLACEARSEASDRRDPNIVDWDGSDDPENPKNWKRSKVIVILTLVSTITFLRFVGQTLSWSFND